MSWEIFLSLHEQLLLYVTVPSYINGHRIFKHSDGELVIGNICSINVDGVKFKPYKDSRYKYTYSLIHNKLCKWTSNGWSRIALDQSHIIKLEQWCKLIESLLYYPLQILQSANCK